MDYLSLFLFLTLGSLAVSAAMGRAREFVILLLGAIPTGLALAIVIALMILLDAGGAR